MCMTGAVSQIPRLTYSKSAKGGHNKTVNRYKRRVLSDEVVEI